MVWFSYVHLILVVQVKLKIYDQLYFLQITDVNVDVKSPFIIIPEEGTFKK